MSQKTYCIHTYGCQMNLADSERMQSVFETLGYVKRDALSDFPDLFVVNTCSVRQAAEDKVYGLAHKVRDLKENNPNAQVIITGCMVGSSTGERTRFDEQYLKRKMPWADHFVETESIATLPKLLDATKHNWNPIANWERIVPHHTQGHPAYIPISIGCDNFCTFCVVPYARGQERSRAQETIMHEVNQAIERGFRHISLVGQNVNSWGIENRTEKFAIRTNSDIPLPFAQLLRDIHGIEGVEKISFISSNPFDFTQDLVTTLALPKIDRYLHLAVQSGDNEILRRMNRRHSREEFLTLLEHIHASVPDIEIGTDLIVGFPGETEEQFMNTVDLCTQARFSVAYISKYSPREGTTAARFQIDDIPRRVKQTRHALLTEIIEQYHPRHGN